MCAARAVPFVVGEWVSGERFYGRDAHITEILDGPRDCVWLLGTRRIGKTSLLRQIELVAERSPERGYLPLFWDFQEAASLPELSRGFREGLRHAEARLERVELRATDVEADDLFASLGRVRRHLRSRRLRLLLLCDDAEGLVRLGRQDPALVRKLGRALQSGEDMRSVLASSIRLWAMAEQKDEASALLQGFIPPVYLQVLLEEEARALVSQAQLPSEARPPIDVDTAERILETSGGHPYLLQLLGQRLLELGGVEEALEQITTDSRVSALFSSDFDSLSEPDQAILGALGEQTTAEPGWLQARLSLDADVLKGSLVRLERLGLVHRDDRHGFALGNHLLRRWVAARRPRMRQPSRAARATAIVVDLSRVEGPAASSPDDLFQAVYDPLRKLAGRYLRRERRGHTLQPTALVHEAYLKLIDQSRVDWKGRSHFFAVGAKVMRRILIDHARSRKRSKRGGDWLRVTLTGLAGPPFGADLDPSQLLALHNALEKLARIDERQARVVELRFFGGLEISEVAEALGVSRRTVDGDWAKARLWLEHELAFDRAPS